MIYQNVINSILQPKLIQLEHNLYTLSFYVMKILPANYIIKKALKSGLIDKETEIIETSSGSFAYGIALVCKNLGLRYHIITDEYMDISLQERLRLLSGNIHFAPPEPGKSSQTTRLELLEKVRNRISRPFWTRQYDNLDNSESYMFPAEYIVGNLDDMPAYTIVGTVGSGGSTCGFTQYLRDKGKTIELVGVDCFNSILFGLQAGTRRLGGFGNGIIPKNLNHTLFDKIHWLSDEYCIAGMQELYEKYSLFCGHTTGAAYLVAKFIAEKNPQKNVIFISPDSGHRYVNTYYNKSWLINNNFKLPKSLQPPNEITKTNQAQIPWAMMDWKRRDLKGETNE